MIYSMIFKEVANNRIVFSKDLLDWYNENQQDNMTLMWDELSEVVHFSHYITNYTSLNPDQLLGQKWTIFFKENEIEKIRQHFTHSSKEYSSANVILTDRDEQEITFQVTIDKVTIDKKHIFICELSNSTYTRELQIQTINSEKLVLAAQLAAGLVHEIRNPLTSLRGFLQLVQSGVQQKNEYFQVMIGEVDKLENITSELLKLSKPFNKQKEKEKLHSLLADVEFMINNQSDMRDLTLEIHCDKEITLYCNGSQIKQVLINIILNGADAMDKKGTIIIHAYLLDGYIIIDIIDEGEGISPEVIREVQQPFFTTKEQGTGLGLVITQHLLELHQAELKISSNQIKGSTFTIILPILNK